MGLGEVGAVIHRTWASTTISRGLLGRSTALTRSLTPWRALEQGTVSSPSLRPTARAPGTASRRTDLDLSQSSSCCRAAGRRRGAGSETDSGSPDHLGHPLLLTQGPHGQGPSPPAGARV